jgi:hypothetical protein
VTGAVACGVDFLAAAGLADFCLAGVLLRFGSVSRALTAAISASPVRPSFFGLRATLKHLQQNPLAWM